jgi:TPP-dependent pyruvate/acetoin dehydrogenase alpha subunit
VDGMDVIAVYNAASEAIARARAGGGPTMVECMVYRYFDHSGFAGYDAKKGIGRYGLYYRSDKELMHWVGKDPIPAFRKTLIGWKVLDEAGADAIVAKVKAEVESAWQWAMAQPRFKGEDILKYQYADGPVTTELPRQLADCPLYA